MLIDNSTSLILTTAYMTVDTSELSVNEETTASLSIVLNAFYIVLDKLSILAFALDTSVVNVLVYYAKLHSV